MGGNKSVKEMGKKHGKDGAVVSRVCPRTGLDTSGLTLCVCVLCPRQDQPRLLCL